MNLLKENSSLIMNRETHSLPPTRVGRKRRSSILKQQRPFTDVQNLSRDDSRTSKDRRVSFCPTIKVKEFDKHNPAGTSNAGLGTGDEGSSDGDVKQVTLLSAEEPHMIQMSTPVKRKKRRISANQINRLSIIPKADKSFTFFPDDDFVIYEDTAAQHHMLPPATAPQDEITLLEELPDPQIGGVELNVDAMMDFDLNETGPAPISSPHPGQSHTDPPSSSHPLPTSESPTVHATVADDTERLMELFPQAALPTIISTPPTANHSSYLAMATPEVTMTPQERGRRRSVGSGKRLTGRRLAGSGGEGAGVSGECASVDQTGPETKDDSIPTELVPASVPVPEMSASCDNHLTLSSTEPPTTGLHPEVVVDEGGGSQMDMTCQSETLQSSTITTPTTPSGTVATPTTTPSGTVATPTTTPSGIVATHTTTTPSGTVATHTTTTPSGTVATHTTTSSGTVATHTTTTPSGTVATHTTTPSGTVATPALEQSEDLPHTTQDGMPHVASTDLPPPPETSPVFKHPKLPLRSQLRLKSSGRKVVKASSIVRTPRAVARSLSSVHTPLTSLPILSTFTKTPLQTSATRASASESVPIVSSPPPSPITPHTSPPPLSPSPTPTVKKEGAPVHSLLASPPLSDCSAPPPQAGSAWLQSPTGSFNLINSEDEALEEATQNSSMPPEFEVNGIIEESENRSSLQMNVDPTHSPGTRLLPSQEATSHIPAAAVATPTVHSTPAPSSQTAHLATALQQLQVSAPKLAAAPVSIETPETALVEVPPALSAVGNDTLHMSSLQTALNDTTMCEHSMLLSASIYDKFVAQICRDDKPPSMTPPHPSLQSTDHSLLPLPASPPSDCPSLLSVSCADKATQSPALFSQFMSDLTTRLMDMLCGVHQRLTCDCYVSSHYCLPIVLDKWSRVLAACLGTLTVLQQYGVISGRSLTHSWSSEDIPYELPQAPLGQEDMDGELAMKIEWIMELIASYNLLLPSALVARDHAAVLYGWHFEEWSHDSHTQHVTVAVQSKHHQFELSVSDIVTDRLSATTSMVESIWHHRSPAELSTPPQD